MANTEPSTSGFICLRDYQLKSYFPAHQPLAVLLQLRWNSSAVKNLFKCLWGINWCAWWKSTQLTLDACCLWMLASTVAALSRICAWRNLQSHPSLLIECPESSIIFSYVCLETIYLMKWEIGSKTEYSGFSGDVTIGERPFCEYS